MIFRPKKAAPVEIKRIILECRHCRAARYVTDRFCGSCGSQLLQDDFNLIAYEEPAPYLSSQDRPESEQVVVYCARCPMDEAFWKTAAGLCVDTVAFHVWQFHQNAAGPRDEHGLPAWEEGEDWWLCELSDLIALRAVQLPRISNEPWSAASERRVVLEAGLLGPAVLVEPSAVARLDSPLPRMQVMVQPVAHRNGLLQARHLVFGEPENVMWSQGP